MIKHNPFVVAEISANHCGSISIAKKLIKSAKKNGADAVKLQTFTESGMTINSNKKRFTIGNGLWKGFTYWELYKKAKTPHSWHKELFKFARQNKIICFSTPFDLNSLELLENLKCPIYKIASFEITDLNLIKHVAKTKKPMIISTGLSKISEIKKAFDVAKKFGAKDITLLYCISSYPAKYDDFNLKNIDILKKKFKCRVGLSDHSKDNRVASLASAMGAEVFEKQIALENQKEGLDIEFSLKGSELRKYKEDLLLSSKIIGQNNFIRKKNELKNLIYRRSLFAIKDIDKGEKFTNKNIQALRPNIGLSPIYFEKLIGKKSKRKIKYGSSIKKNDI